MQPAGWRHPTHSGGDHPPVPPAPFGGCEVAAKPPLCSCESVLVNLFTCPLLIEANARAVGRKRGSVGGRVGSDRGAGGVDARRAHSIHRYAVSEDTLRTVFYEPGCRGVALGGMVLKPNLVTSGLADAERWYPAGGGGEGLLPRHRGAGGGSGDRLSRAGAQALERRCGNVLESPKALLHWARLNVTAGRGRYSAEMEQAVA